MISVWTFTRSWRWTVRPRAAASCLTTQLLRMLPGGLNVIGLYVIHRGDIFTQKYETNVKSLLGSLVKQLGMEKKANYATLSYPVQLQARFPYPV
jgi:hypothetical protein